MDIEHNSITEGNILKQLLIFFMPIFIGNLFQQLYSIVDSIFIGNKVGPNGLAAIGANSTIITLLIYFFVGVGSGATVIISQHFGAKNKEEIKHAVDSAMLISIISGILLTFFGIYFAKDLLILINVPNKILSESTKYLQIYLAASIPLIVYNMVGGILRAIGDSKTPTYILMIGTTINILLDYIFIYILNLGVIGAAIATSISMTIAAIISIIVLERKISTFRFTEFFKHIYKKPIKNIIKLGLPIGLETSMFTLSNTIVRAAMYNYGTNIIASINIYDKVEIFETLIINSVAIALTTFVAQNYGAKKYQRVKESLKISLLSASLITVVFSVVCMLNIDAISMVFVKDQNVIDSTYYIAKYIVPFYIVFIPAVIISAAIKGCGNSFIPMMISLICTCVVRIIWIFTLDVNAELYKVLIVYPITWSLTASVFITYYIYFRRKVLKKA